MEVDVIEAKYICFMEYYCILPRVHVQREDGVLEVCPTILTEDSMQAQHLAATLALYNLVKGQVLHVAYYTFACLPYREYV